MMIPPIVGLPPDQYLSAVQTKIAITKQLTDALFAWLTFDDCYRLESIQKTTSQSFETENLVFWQKALDAERQKKDAMDVALSKLQKLQPEIIDLLHATVVLPIEQNISDLERSLSETQARLEAEK